MTTPVKEECEFYAKTDKAFTFKVTIDIMKNLLQKVLHLKINSDGLFSCQSEHEMNSVIGNKSNNKANHYLKAFYKAKTWNTFHCSRERCLELNLSELCNICKNIRKKFSLLLYIKKSETDKLYIIPLPSSTYEDHNHLARRLPITDIKLNFSTEDSVLDYKFHNGLSCQIFHSMCKNFTSARCSIFTFLMYKSGRIYCTSEGTFSDCFFENGKGTLEESDHESRYRKYIESCRQKDDDEEITDELENLLAFEFYTGTFNCKLLKDIQKLYGYGTNIHVYSDPIDQEKDEPSRPICFECTAPDSFVLEIYVKSIEQIEHEKNMLALKE